VGISQPDISRLLKGQFRDVSVERIPRMLTRLGCGIDIIVTPQGGNKAATPIHVHAAPV
jgi:predicted XRE-type DNA-binding protein